MWSDDAEDDPRINREAFVRFPLGSMAFVPMIAKEQPIGGLFLVWETRRPALTRDELMLAEGICRQAAIAVGNARLYDEARQTLEELRRTQEQLTQSQKMDAVGRLAGGIAHDFNNLLTVIMGYSELLLLELAPDTPQRKSMEIIATTAARAAKLTRQLLAFSRKQILAPTLLDLNTVVTEMTDILHRLIGASIELVFAPAEDLGLVEVDRGQIEQ